MASWNLWHGCSKISAGCKNCYVYRRDESIGLDPSDVHKTKSFDLPIRKNRAGEYKLPSGSMVYTCFTSDFFLPEADEWRIDAWKMIRARSDCTFFMVTKRIDRFFVNLPDDWGSGYDNVIINSTVENQAMADYRLPILLDAPIKHKGIACEPLLEQVNLRPYLTADIEFVGAGGESGKNARICEYDWILDIRDACLSAGVQFSYHQTGARLRKDGKLYYIPRKYQHSQAHKAGIDT